MGRGSNQESRDQTTIMGLYTVQDLGFKVQGLGG